MAKSDGTGKRKQNENDTDTALKLDYKVVRYQCAICDDDVEYKTASNCERHLTSAHSGFGYRCSGCKSVSTRNDFRHQSCPPDSIFILVKRSTMESGKDVEQEFEKFQSGRRLKVIKLRRKAEGEREKDEARREERCGRNRQGSRSGERDRKGKDGLRRSRSGDRGERRRSRDDKRRSRSKEGEEKRQSRTAAISQERRRGVSRSEKDEGRKEDDQNFNCLPVFDQCPQGVIELDSFREIEQLTSRGPPVTIAEPEKEPQDIPLVPQIVPCPIPVPEPQQPPKQTPSSSSSSTIPEVTHTPRDRLKLRISSVASDRQKRLLLNVGGTKFETCVRTLQSDPSSLLAMMISQDSPCKPYEVNNVYTYFLDRDPSHFKYILNYLRNKNLVPLSRGLPLSHRQLEELLAEAVFYNLEGLERIIEDRLAS